MLRERVICKCPETECVCTVGRSGVVTVSGLCDVVVVAFEKLLDRILDGFLEPPTPLALAAKQKN